MSKSSTESIVYSKNVIEFVTVANEFCAFAEKNGRFTLSEFIDKLQKLFPLLYLKASLLPVLVDEFLDTPEKFVNEVDYNYLLNKISEKLGQFDSYQEVFDANMQFSETALEASLAENVCDIYQDLKDFLMAFQIGSTDVMMDALWECQNNFATYWGQKLVNGLRAIHSLRYSNVDLNEDNQFKHLEKNEEEIDDEEDESWVSKHFNSYSEEEDLKNNDL